MEGLIISLISGAVGGNVAGSVMKSGHGMAGRSIIGIIGGLLLSIVAGKLGIAGIADPFAGGGLNTSTIVGNLVSGVLGGGVLTGILGMLKK